MIPEYYPILFGTAAVIAWIIYSLLKKVPYKKIFLIAVCIVYMTCIISITLFPLVYDKALCTSADTLENRFLPVPFTTFKEMFTHWAPFMIAVQGGGNIVMTIPFGILAPLVFKNKKKPFFILLAFLFPLCIEVTQFTLGISLGTLYRTADADDIILNAAGIFIGYGILFITKKLRQRIKSNTSTENS